MITVIFVNWIEAMEAVLYNNNGNIDVDWYEVVDIYLVQIQNEFLYEGVSNADVILEEDYDQTVEMAFLDDEPIQISNISINNIDKIRFYDNSWAHMNGGAKCPMTNYVDILWNVPWYDKNKPTVHVMGAISGQIIIPVAKDLLWIHVNTSYGYNYLQCSYSPHFTSNLLSDRD